IDRRFVAELLGFDEPSNNSLDGVSDRDFAAEFIFAASNTMVHLSRYSEELILFSSQDYGYISIDEAYSTGSSIMPQKHNPDIAELVRGKTARVLGGLTAILTLTKGLPLAYNKDLQEDKEIFFGVYDTLTDCIKVFTGMISSVQFNVETMLAACKTGYINATDVADYLVSKKGVPFRTAYEIVGALVSYALSKKAPLDKLTLKEFNTLYIKTDAVGYQDALKEFERLQTAGETLFDADIYSKIDIYRTLGAKASYGGPAKTAVKQSIKNLRKRLKALSN
ncbi:MAG: argininosuccinate lyase, partial [Clostridiales bacterium]|nr:argininosuccinate lyase [Clostridiales bacterium]